MDFNTKIKSYKPNKIIILLAKQFYLRVLYFYNFLTDINDANSEQKQSFII